MTSSEDSPSTSRMAASAMITAQDEGPTWAWFCVAPDVPSGKLWRVAWCADRLLDHTPNDVTQKPQTCDVILSSMGEVRLWGGASYTCWNDDFWLETRAIFLTYRTPRILPHGIRTLGVTYGPWHHACSFPGMAQSRMDLRMAGRVSTCVDLTAGCDKCPSFLCPSKRLESAALDHRQTAGSDLLGTDPSTPEIMTPPVAVERSESPWLLVTERSSAELEGPSWMAGTHTGGPSRCPRALTWRLSTLPWGPDMTIQIWWVVCWRMSQTSGPSAHPSWQTRVVDAPWPWSTPYSVSGRLWTGNPPGCCGLLADGREPM